MRKISFAGIVMALALLSFISCSFAKEAANPKKSVFDRILEKTLVKEGVKRITYKQLMEIRKAGEPYVLLDVLSAESYKNGHIAGARNFPVNTIDSASAGRMLSKNDRIVVYCGSFGCLASTDAAKNLGALGYQVLDYKGGLKEWVEKGNSLEK